MVLSIAMRVSDSYMDDVLRQAFLTSKRVPRPWCFNNFGFQIALSPLATAWCKFCGPELPKVLRSIMQVFNDFDFGIALSLPNFAGFNFKEYSDAASSNDFDLKIVLSLQRDANFDGILGSRSCALVFRN